MMNLKEALFVGFLCVLGVIGWFLVLNRMIISGNSGGMLVWVPIGAMFGVTLICSLYELVSVLIKRRKYKSKYGNVKVGDCLK